MIAKAKEAGAMFCGPYRVDNHGNQQEVRFCNADLCMMWRWAHERNAMADPPSTGGDRLGYCGLAGAP